MEEAPENPVGVELVVVVPVPERLKVKGAEAPGTLVLELIGVSAKLKEKFGGSTGGLTVVVEPSVMEVVDGGATTGNGVAAIVDVTVAAEGVREVDENVKLEGVTAAGVAVVVVIMEAGAADPERDESSLNEKLVFKVGTGSVGLDATSEGVEAEADKIGGTAKPNEEVETTLVACD